MKHFNLSAWNSDFIQAFSWTLIHSLWQGLVLAVLAGILLLSTRNVRPAVRYNILSVLMLSFVLVNCVTFFLEYSDTNSGSESMVQSSEVILSQIQWNRMTPERVSVGFFSQALQFLSQNAGIIVTVWFLIFLAKSLKTFTGLLHVQRLRTRYSYSVDSHWDKRINELSARLRFKGKVLLRQSEQVITPVVTGILKPMVIVPVGFFIQLPQAEIEAILLHELAHARRQDFLVNLIQNFAESIYFFNPGLWWVSYLVRQEREHCCDDLAISAVSDKKIFVNALVVYQEYKLNESAQLVAFAGRRNDLLYRIKRIINNYNKPLDAMEKLFVTVSLLSGAALLAAFQNAQIPTLPPPPPVAVSAPAAPPTPPSPPAPIAPEDTIPVPSEPDQIEGHEETSTYHITKNKKRYEITEVDGEITNLKINGKTIAADKISDFEEELKPVLAELKTQNEEAEELREQAEEMRVEAEELRKEAIELKKEAETMRVEAVKASELAYLDQGKKHALIRESQLLAAQAKELASIDTQALRISSEELRKHAIILKKEAETLRVSAEAERVKANKSRDEFEKLQQAFNAELKKDGIITSTDNLSYRLTDSEFVVNGVKQSSSVQSRYKLRFLHSKGSELVYNWKDVSGHTITGSVQRK
ncbi:MAG TPA: M56 family metallopeptidase [Dyadobacter sp.]|nr:M56 family metallopeptidase [Dyadobacter sp.]